MRGGSLLVGKMLGFGGEVLKYGVKAKANMTLLHARHLLGGASSYKSVRHFYGEIIEHEREAFEQ